MKFGYARISTSDQILDLQIDPLGRGGCEKIFQETVSGTKTERVEFNGLLEPVREGDVIVVRVYQSSPRRRPSYRGVKTG